MIARHECTFLSQPIHALVQFFFLLEHNSLKDAGFVAATSASKAAETKTNDILAMISPEGERVGLTKVRKISLIFEHVTKCKQKC